LLKKLWASRISSGTRKGHGGEGDQLLSQRKQSVGPERDSPGVLDQQGPNGGRPREKSQGWALGREIAGCPGGLTSAVSQPHGDLEF